MEIEIEKVGDIIVVSALRKNLDANTAKPFGRAVTAEVDANANVVLDLSRVEYVDSGGCGALITCLRHLRSGGGDLKLCGINKPVRVLFQLVRLHLLLDIFNTREEALKAYQI